MKALALVIAAALTLAGCAQYGGYYGKGRLRLLLRPS